MTAVVNIRRLSEGHFSQVFGISSDRNPSANNLVIKIGGNCSDVSEDSWWDYAKWVMSVRAKKVCPGRQHLPDIRFIDKDAAVAVMTKMVATVHDMSTECRIAVMDKYFTVHPLNGAVCHLDSGTSHEMIRSLWNEISNFASRCSSKAKHSGLHKKKKVHFKMPKGFHPKKSFKDFIHLIRWVAKNYEHELNDLHSQNMMIDADFNIVITDPSSWRS
jgi:hypothetical protein